MTVKINPKMSVADLLEQAPEAVPVFIRHQMACVGCSMSAFEALEDAAKVYRIDPEVFLRELQTVCSDSGHE